MNKRRKYEKNERKLKEQAGNNRQLKQKEKWRDRETHIEKRKIRKNNKKGKSEERRDEEKKKRIRYGEMERCKYRCTEEQER